MICRDCDKIEPRGVGKTCCSVTGKTINDFDAECQVKENEECQSTTV